MTGAQKIIPTDEELEKYREFIKSECFKCGKPIKNPILNYFMRGNYCYDCAGRLERRRKNGELKKNSIAIQTLLDEDEI